MYISRRNFTDSGDASTGVIARTQALHTDMPAMPGFRWAMLLRSTDEPRRLAAIDMWQTPEDEAAANRGDVAGEAAHGYDVVTARGAMTPAAAVAIVDWQIDDASTKAFTERWNAAYHAVEDSIGSRLGRDLAEAGRYTGFHVARDAAALDARILAAELALDAGATARPLAIQRFEAVLVTES